MVDMIIVGAGFAGAVVANRAAEADKKVLVLVFLVCYNVICSSLFYGFNDPCSS